MIVYQTDKDGYFLWEVEADEDPLNPGTYLVPGGCTEIAPPEEAQFSVRQFANGEWSVLPNFVGVTYWLPDGSEHTISEIGITLPEGALGFPPDIAPTLEQIKASLEVLVEKHVDDFAKTWGYNSVYTAATYLTSHIPKFQAEAQALVTWRDNVWYFVEDLDARVGRGETPPPENAVALIAMLPLPPERPVV